MGKKRRNHSNQKKYEAVYADLYADMDSRFAYIAGYTPGGAPYGLTWEKGGIDSELPFEEKVRLYMKKADEAAETLNVDCDDELPFD